MKVIPVMISVVLFASALIIIDYSPLFAATLIGLSLSIRANMKRG